MATFLREAVVLFIAFRFVDLINFIVGIYLVPRFIQPNDLGAVLPVSTIATCVSIPAFACALVFMREGAQLARANAWGEWKSLVRGVFAITGLVLAGALLLALTILPSFLRAVGVHSFSLGLLACTGAFLGCLAPIYSDALNAIRRFHALGLVEVLSALARLFVLMIVMPFRALGGYFLGGVIQPFTRLVVSILFLHREMSVPARPYWTRPVARRLARQVCLVTLYLLAPLVASLAEQSVLRLSLGAHDSAAYYVLTRLSGLVDYLTLPLLFVLFPRAAQATDPHETRRLVLGCQMTVCAVAVLGALLSAFEGPALLMLIPTGASYLDTVHFLPWLFGIAALNACQIFATNASVAEGRFQFLWWLVPLNSIFALLLTVAPGIVSDLPALLIVSTALAVLRFVFGQTTISQPRESDRASGRRFFVQPAKSIFTGSQSKPVSY